MTEPHSTAPEPPPESTSTGSKDPSTRSQPHLRVTKLWYATGPLLVVLLVAVIVAAIRPVPYFTISPGSARAVEPLVTITAHKGDTKPPPIDPADKGDEELFFVTVTVRKPAGIEALASLLDDTVEIVPEQVIVGTQSRADNTRFNLSLMTSSKDKAAKVALDRAGFPVTVTTTGAVIVDVGPDYPAAKVLKPGDTVIAADGQKIRSAKDLVAVIGKEVPGNKVRLTIEGIGDGVRRTAVVRLAARPEDRTKPLLGVSLESRPSYDFPFDVSIDSGDVGGPSAGLAFTLAILDRITPGDLTGGKAVAVTGTIELDASIGPVGGVTQKTEAAINAGAKLFMVPADEYADAVKAARGRIEIRRVTTLEEALATLQNFGGDPLPAAPTPAPEASVGG